jgi:hypothetical protein
MECELWDQLYVLVRRTAKECRRPGAQVCDASVVLVLLWAALRSSIRQAARLTGSMRRLCARASGVERAAGSMDGRIAPTCGRRARS